MQRKGMLYIALLLGLVYSCMQSREVTENKGGPKPGWAQNTMAADYIIGRGRGDTRDKAKTKAMLDVRKQITEAVAVKVETVTKLKVENIVKGQTPETTTNFRQNTESRTAKVDFLQGISASKADDFYWEQQQNEKTGKAHYVFLIKYPFSETELERLIQKFKKKDREYTRMLNELLAITRNYTSVEELEGCLRQLRQLSDLFVDERKQKVLSGMEKCRELLKSLYIADEGSQPGVVKYSLKIGDRRVTSAKTPTVESNCAALQNRDFGKRINTIAYSSEPCYEEPGNFIRVSYRTMQKQVSKKFPVNAAAGKVEIELYGNIMLHPAKGKVRLKIHSKYNTPIVIKSIELSNEVIDLNLYEEVNREMAFKGKKDVTFSVEPFELREGYTSAEVNGYLHYNAKGGSEKQSIRIYRVEASVAE